MGPVAAQECLGSHSSCPPQRNSVAPATAMLSKPPTPSLRRLVIPPLNAERFNGSFTHFCSIKGLVPDQEPLLRMGEPGGLNLHSLHQEIMRRRGYDRNERRPGFWLNIGKQLNFIHSEPDASPASAEAADRLATIYEQYLQQFDAIYVVSYMQELEYRRAHPTSIG